MPIVIIVLGVLVELLGETILLEALGVAASELGGLAAAGEGVAMFNMLRRGEGAVVKVLGDARNLSPAAQHALGTGVKNMQHGVDAAKMGFSEFRAAAMRLARIGSTVGHSKLMMKLVSSGGRFAIGRTGGKDVLWFFVKDSKKRISVPIAQLEKEGIGGFLARAQAEMGASKLHYLPESVHKLAEKLRSSLGGLGLSI